MAESSRIVVRCIRQARCFIHFRHSSTAAGQPRRKKAWQQWLRPGEQADDKEQLKPVRSKIFARKPIVFSSSSFKSFDLSNSILSDLKKYQLSHTTVIQKLAFPKLLNHPDKDYIIAAETGTGKTLTYLLPLMTHLEHNRSSEGAVSSKQARAIVVAPTRELGRQIYQHALALNSTTRLRVQASLNDIQSHDSLLADKGCDLLIAVPGRLLELVQTRQLDLTETRHITLDELDVLLNDFQDDLVPVLARCRPEFQGETSIQTASRHLCRFVGVAATISAHAFHILHTCLPAVKVISTEQLHRAPANVEHQFVKVRGPNAKPTELLHALHNKTEHGRAIVFVNDADTLAWAVQYLREHGIDSAALGGSLARATRAKEWVRFASRQVDVLVCTDIASRGLDVENVDVVINYNFPFTSSDYLHRCGRTGRVGRRGLVVNLINKKERHVAQLTEVAVKKRQRLNDLYDQT